jgi:hypothetical protein
MVAKTKVTMPIHGELTAHEANGNVNKCFLKIQCEEYC